MKIAISQILLNIPLICKMSELSSQRYQNILSIFLSTSQEKIGITYIFLVLTLN